MAGKADLVDRIAELTGIPKTHVAMVYDNIFDLTSEALAEGDDGALVLAAHRDDDARERLVEGDVEGDRLGLGRHERRQLRRGVGVGVVGRGLLGGLEDLDLVAHEGLEVDTARLQALDIYGVPA